MITLSELYVYPVKSMRGTRLEQGRLDPFGLESDRRWMVVDSAKRFLTARTCPQLTTIVPLLQAKDKIALRMPDGSTLDVPRADAAMPHVSVTVWDDRVDAVHLSHSVDTALSNLLNQQCSLVYFPDTHVRQVDLTYANQGDVTGFSDGFPLLLVSTASLEDLNQRLEKRVTMLHFRPNLVVSGCDAFAEDNWKHITIGDTRLDIVKPCSRCVMTTVDPVTGILSGKEPLKTLANYRRQGNKVMFGQNVIQRSLTTLQTGTQVTIHA